MDQATAIDFAKSAKIGGAIGAGAATGIAGGMAIFMIFGFMCSGLVGFLLTMKKRVLQCKSCGAIVAAS
jgi:hypothetical protein